MMKGSFIPTPCRSQPTLQNSPRMNLSNDINNQNLQDTCHIDTVSATLPTNAIRNQIAQTPFESAAVDHTPANKVPLVDKPKNQEDMNTVSVCWID